MKVEIDHVALRVDGHRVSVKKLQQRVTQLEQSCSSTSTSESSQEALAALDETHKLARNCAEDLLEDTLALDKLCGLASDARATRKNVIGYLQAMLDTVDEIKSRITRLRQTLEANLETLKANTRDEKGNAEKAQRPCEASMSRDMLQVETPNTSFWQKMPLRPHSQLQDAEDRYILTIPVENVDSDHLELVVSEDHQHLHIRGIRLPTSHEASQLQARVEFQLGQHRRSRHITNQEAKDLVERLYAAAGRGSFGVFTETVQIPRDVHAHSIKATCHKGYVSVTLPRAVQQEPSRAFGQRPEIPLSACRYSGRPSMPLSARQYGRHPFRNSLFSDMW